MYSAEFTINNPHIYMDVSIPRVSRVSPRIWSAPGWVLPLVGYANGCRVGYYMPMVLSYNAKF